MPATFKQGPLAGIVIVQPHVSSDLRGCFQESYKLSEYCENGIPYTFVQDNLSVNSKGVLRGLHFQKGEYAQGKLINVAKGAVWDVAVDLRKSSSTFGLWFGLELSERNCTQLFIPPGFAHGFLTLEQGTILCYKCTAEYNASSEGGLRWDDAKLSIDWPIADVPIILSSRDRHLPSWDTWHGSESS